MPAPDHDDTSTESSAFAGTTAHAAQSTMHPPLGGGDAAATGARLAAGAVPSKKGFLSKLRGAFK